MQMCDFARSFVFFTTKTLSNTARIQAEAHCHIEDRQQGTKREYLLAASCKAEDTYAERPLFRDPNYDFCGVFSEQDFLILRTPAVANGSQNSAGPVQSMFHCVRLLIATTQVHPLTTPGAIAQATLEGRPLFGRTQFADASGRFQVTLDYPIKTMNAHVEKERFQVDTGPVPFPHFEPEGFCVEGFRLAYIAYNTFERAEFLLQVPTPVHPQVRVPHYSRRVEWTVRNTVAALA